MAAAQRQTAAPSVENRVAPELVMTGWEIAVLIVQKLPVENIADGSISLRGRRVASVTVEGNR
jgi:hypothetical protein